MTYVDAEDYVNQLTAEAAYVYAYADESELIEYLSELDEPEQMYVAGMWDEWTEEDEGLDLDLDTDPTLAADDADEYYEYNRDEIADGYDEQVARIKAEHPSIHIRDDIFNQYVAELGGDLETAFEWYKDAYTKHGRAGHGATLDDAAALLSDDMTTAARHREARASTTQSLDEAMDDALDDVIYGPEDFDDE